MPVGALKFDRIDTFGPQVRDGRIRASISADFAKILSGLQMDGAASDTTPAMTRSEVARTSAVVGHVRLITIRFSDGSCDVQVGAADSATPQAAPSPFQDERRSPPAGFKALSDLEPEPGLDSRSASSDPWAAWKPRPVGKPRARRPAPAVRRAESGPSDLQLRIQSLDEAMVGSLIDILS